MHALLVVLLLNLSGHVFLHLGDAVSVGDETHVSSHQESKTASTPQHPCAVCQDHQHLSLESQPVAALIYTASTAFPLREHDATPSFLPAHFKPTRAPPRS